MRQFKNVEIILEESQAVLANSFYIIPIGNGKARGVITDANGAKVEIGDIIPENIGLTDFDGSGGETSEGNVYRKDQIDLMIDLVNERLDQAAENYMARYNDADDTLAGDILKRVDKTTGENVNYRETTTWNDGILMTDAKVDGVIYIKKNDKYYKRQFEGAVNVKWFGVKGDGVTNDSALLQEIFDYEFPRVFFPKGDYVLENMCSFNSDIEIFGEYGTRIISKVILHEGYRGAIHCYPTKDKFLTVKIHDIEFVGEVATKGHEQHNHLVALSNTIDANITNCRFIGFRGDGIIFSAGNYMNPPATTRQNFRATINNCYFDGLVAENRNGISFINIDEALVDRCVFKNIGSSQPNQSVGAIDFESDIRNSEMATAKTKVTNCYFENCNKTNISCITLWLGSVETNFINVRNHIIDGNTFVNCYTGIGVNGASDNVLNENEIYKNVIISNNNFKNNVVDISAESKGVKIINNSFENTQNISIHFSPFVQVKDNVVSNNYFTNCGYTMKVYAVDDLLISNNLLENCTYFLALGTPTSISTTVKNLKVKENKHIGEYMFLDDIGYTANISKETNIYENNITNGQFMARGSIVFSHQ